MNYVFQINSSVKLTRTNFPNKCLYDYLHTLLDPEGEYVTDEMREMIMVPVSIICYSRKAVGESADRLVAIDNFCEDNTPFEASKDKKSKAGTKYDISLLRKCLKVALKDHQSSRNVMATYETDSHINHAVQKAIIDNYEKRISDLALLYFGNNIPDYELDTFEPKDCKYAKQIDENTAFDNANAHYVRECLNMKQRNIYCDRKDDYDSFLNKVLLLENDSCACESCYVLELRELVFRWYYRRNHRLAQHLATSEQKQRNTLPPGNIQSSSSHYHYPLPNLNPKTYKDLKEIVLSMKPFFYNFSVFVTLLETEERGLKGPLGKMIESSMFDGYNHVLFKRFKLDEWYRSRCYEDCNHENNVLKFDALLMDPTETYQGPKMMMPAGWNKIVSLFSSVYI